jgi:hypothetical protein
MTSLHHERRPDGRLEIWCHAAMDNGHFRRCGERLARDFGAEAFERFVATDQIFWDFMIAGGRVTLHLDFARGFGVIAHDQTANSEELTKRVAAHLADTK